MPTIVSNGLPVPTNEAQARIVRAIEAASDSTMVELPNERQVRELGRIPEAERAGVWRETVERTDGNPTAAAVRETYTARADIGTDSAPEPNTWAQPDDEPIPGQTEILDAELVDEPAGRRPHWPLA